MHELVELLNRKHIRMLIDGTSHGNRLSQLNDFYILKKIQTNFYFKMPFQLNSLSFGKFFQLFIGTYSLECQPIDDSTLSTIPMTNVWHKIICQKKQLKKGGNFN